MTEQQECGIPYGARLSIRAIGLLLRCGLNVRLLSTQWLDTFTTAGRLHAYVDLRGPAYTIYDPDDNIWRYVFVEEWDLWLIPDSNDATKALVRGYSKQPYSLTADMIYKGLPSVTIHYYGLVRLNKLQQSESNGIPRVGEFASWVKRDHRLLKNAAKKTNTEVATIEQTTPAVISGLKWSNDIDEDSAAKRYCSYQDLAETMAENEFPDCTDEDIDEISHMMRRNANNINSLFNHLQRHRSTNLEATRDSETNAEQRGSQAVHKQYMELRPEIVVAKSNVESFAEGLKGFLSKKQLSSLQVAAQAMDKILKIMESGVERNPS